MVGTTLYLDEEIRVFVNAIKDALDAQEFEALMTGAEVIDSDGDSMDFFWDMIAKIDLSQYFWMKRTALSTLKMEKAMERLTSRYPDAWAEAQMSTIVDTENDVA